MNWKRWLLTQYLRLRFPGWRLDWVAPYQVVITNREGQRWLAILRPRYRPKQSDDCSLLEMVLWMVPALIVICSAWMVTVLALASAMGCTF